MAPLLERSLGRRGEVQAVRVSRVSFKAGERVSVHYEVTVDGETEDAVARAVAGRDLAGSARRPRVAELARRIGPRSPAATPVVYEPAADALITWLPLDPRLPALAEPPRVLARRLCQAGAHAPSELPPTRLLAYKPGRRAVLRFDGLVLKVYAAQGQFEAAAAALRSGFVTRVASTPACEAVLDPLRMTAQSAVAGAPVASLEAAAEAGKFLRELQQSELRRLTPASGERTVVSSVRRKATLIKAVVPGVGPRVDSLVRRLERREPQARRLVPAHGDFHAGQLLRVDGKLCVLDLDSMCLAAPALDLAEYVAAAGERVDARVVDALFGRCGSRPESFDWHLAAAILIRAAHPFHQQLPEWADLVEARVSVAEAVLAGEDVS